MAKVVHPLTNTQIKQFKPTDKVTKLSDGSGLQLQVNPNGSKYWIFNYVRPIYKSRTTISFGVYPEVSLAQARNKRVEARELIAKDIDPKTHKESLLSEAKERNNNTLGSWALHWQALKAKEVKPSTINKAYNSVNRYILTSLKDMAIAEIRVKHIKPLLDPLVNQDKRETVKRLCMFLNEIMRLAMAANVIEFNPLSDITKLFPTAQKKHQPTITPKQLPELMRKIAVAHIAKTTRCLFEFQLHTMTRPIEAASAMWQDIDLEKRIWVIPPTRMKMKKPHIIPLSDYVVQLLNTIRLFSEEKAYLFPSAKDPSSHANSQTVNMMLKRNGYKGQLVAHGLRAIGSTTLNEQGFDYDVIEAALAHVDKDEVRRAYNRTDYLDKRRSMMQWWSVHIVKCSQGDLTVAGI
jgi:integrase